MSGEISGLAYGGNRNRTGIATCTGIASGTGIRPATSTITTVTTFYIKIHSCVSDDRRSQADASAVATISTGTAGTPLRGICRYATGTAEASISTLGRS